MQKILEYTRTINSSITEEKITIGHLRNFCEDVIYYDYFQSHFTSFINETYDQEEAEQFAHYIDEWNNRNKNFFGTTSEGNIFSLELYPYSFLAINETFGIKVNRDSNKFVLIPTNTDFESTYGFNIPNIRIFCSGPITVENYIQYSYNRFTFFHEMGHATLMKKMDVNININEKKYNLTVHSNIFETIYDLLHFADDDMEIFLSNDKLGFEELVGNGDININAILDIIADMLATSSMVKELKDLGINDKNIFDIMVSIYSRLSGNLDHFKSSLRSLLNIYMSKSLKDYYEVLISKDGETPYIDEKYNGIDKSLLQAYADKIFDVKLNNETNINKIKEKIKKEKEQEIEDMKNKISADNPKLAQNALRFKIITETNKINNKYSFYLSSISILDDKSLIEDVILQYVREKNTQAIDYITNFLENLEYNEVNYEKYKEFFLNFANGNISQIDYRKKYLKYKLKYNNLKKSNN